MRTAGKKVSCSSSRNSFPKELESNLGSSGRSKKVFKVSNNKICKHKSNMRRIIKRKNITNVKPIGILKNVSGCTSAKYQSSLKLVGKKTSRQSYWKNMKGLSGDVEIRKLDKRRTRRRMRKNIALDEGSRLQRRARYMLIKMKLEQNLIDAYSGDGWKGQSREKLKPEKELQRAEKQILKCKLGIRDIIHQLDMLSFEGRIQDSVMYPDGSVSHEHIFCAICKSREASPDNDIILCDGTCNCGFHQKCLEPPLEKIPPGDQGWLCKTCECKMEILEVINAHLGTCFTVNSTWEDIFKEATLVPDAENTFLDLAEEWPSEDSEDDDYHPERTENSNSRTGIEENVSDDASSSTSSFCSSDEARTYSNLAKYKWWNGGAYHAKHKRKNDFEPFDSISSSDCETSEASDIISFRRQRRDVDYKKLYDEMFGKELNDNDQQSEDEDWGPRRRKQRRESGRATDVVDCGGEDGISNPVLGEKISHEKRRLFRIPPDAVEKLRQVFAVDELPSRALKENLSKELGISSEKISKWFKNARYAALKNRKELQAEFTSQPPMDSIGRSSRRNSGKDKNYDEVKGLDNSYLLPLASFIRVPNHFSRILRRKNPESLTAPHRKQHKRATNALPTNNIQARALLKAKDASQLKRQLSDLERKFHWDETCKTKTTVSRVDEMSENELPCSVEMERLCSLQDRIQNLKKTLLTCRDNDSVPSKSHSREQNVIYVPVGEVKVKVKC